MANPPIPVSLPKMRELWSRYSSSYVPETPVQFPPVQLNGTFDGRSVIAIESFWFHDSELQTIAWVWRLLFDMGDPVDVPTYFRVKGVIHILDW